MVNSDLRPYWNSTCADISARLPMPTKRALEELSSEHNLTFNNSWFSINHISFPNLNTNKVCLPTPGTSQGISLIKTKLVRIYPTTSQKVTFKKWIGVSRKVYNQTLALLKDREARVYPNGITLKKVILSTLPDYCKEVPYQIKGEAVKEACNTVVKCIKHYRSTGEVANAKFRSRKDQIQSIYIPKQAIRESGIYSRISGNGLKYTEALPEECMDSRLVCKYGRWFLAIPIRSTTIFTENQGRVVALDPGVRKFFSYFSEDSVGFIARSANKYLFKKLLELDKLVSKIATSTGKKKYKLRKAYNNARFRVSCLIDELHWKTINFLLKTYDTVILPTFRASGMVSKMNRKLKAKSVRQMLTLSHFKFSQRLEFKCRELGKSLVRTSEAFTSKTVSWNGEIQNNLGSRESITSNGIEMDRDLNGARGIFLRALIDHPEELKLNLI